MVGEEPRRQQDRYLGLRHHLGAVGFFFGFGILLLWFQIMAIVGLFEQEASRESVLVRAHSQEVRCVYARDRRRSERHPQGRYQHPEVH